MLMKIKLTTKVMIGSVSRVLQIRNSSNLILVMMTGHQTQLSSLGSECCFESKEANGRVETETFFNCLQNQPPRSVQQKNLFCKKTFEQCSCYGLVFCVSSLFFRALDHQLRTLLDGCFYAYQNIIGKYLSIKIIRHKPKSRILLKVKVFMNVFPSFAMGAQQTL